MMIMIKRVVFVCALAVGGIGVGASAGCNKPSASDCKKAINNIKTLLGTDKLSQNDSSTAAWVRSCQGSAKKKSVQCAIEASTLEQLKRCGLLKGDELEELEQMEQEEKAREREKAAAAAAAKGAGTGTAAGTAMGTGTGTGTATRKASAASTSRARWAFSASSKRATAANSLVGAPAPPGTNPATSPTSQSAAAT